MSNIKDDGFWPIITIVVAFVVLGGIGTGGSMLGGTTVGAVDSEVPASAQVVDTVWKDGAVVATIEVVNNGNVGGTVGLHVHFWANGCGQENGRLLHSHVPSIYVDGGETKTFEDTASSFDTSKVDCVSAHVHN